MGDARLMPQFNALLRSSCCLRNSAGARRTVVHISCCHYQRPFRTPRRGQRSSTCFNSLTQPHGTHGTPDTIRHALLAAAPALTHTHYRYGTTPAAQHAPLPPRATRHRCTKPHGTRSMRLKAPPRSFGPLRAHVSTPALQNSTPELHSVPALPYPALS